ncbi:MAG: hypothetical protein KJZ59_00760 [Pararhodobacter sp.]|nr:hypothetical protein [Pararhodobacter sp.]
MRWAWILAAVLMTVGLAPAVGMGLARSVAALAGCPIITAFPQSCEILGTDWGAWLTWLAGTSWLMFLTAPVALAGFALAIGLAVLALFRRARD